VVLYSFSSAPCNLNLVVPYFTSCVDDAIAPRFFFVVVEAFVAEHGWPLRRRHRSGHNKKANVRSFVDGRARRALPASALFVKAHHRR
jgi:hypothetical protein